MAGSNFSTPTTNNSRIADASRTWQAACDGPVTGWNKQDEFVAALIAECGAHSGATETFKVQWSKDDSTWNDLETSGELIQGDATVLVNCTSPVGASSGCQTLEDSHEIENYDRASLTTTGKTFIEIQVAIDPANALDAQIYYFRLYSVTAEAALGRVTATLTTAAGAQEKSADDTGGGSESLLKEREAAVSEVGGGSDTVLPEKEKAIAETGGGTEAVSKFVIADKSVGDLGGGGESVSLLKIISKIVSETGGGIEAITRERDMFIAETGGGMAALLKERFITISESGYGSDSVEKEVEGGEKAKAWPWHYRRP